MHVPRSLARVHGTRQFRLISTMRIGFLKVEDPVAWSPTAGPLNLAGGTAGMQVIDPSRTSVAHFPFSKLGFSRACYVFYLISKLAY
jgi:hypothetical protein